jgi:transposase
MSAIALTEYQWINILNFLEKNENVYIGRKDACRLFIEAVLWAARSGAQWRLLPEKYGKWNSVCKRFARRSDKGVWEALHEFCIKDPDLENILTDSTVIRAHPCAAGASEKHGGQKIQALGRSRGGFSTKIHIAVDVLGNPLRYILTPGQTHDITQAENLVSGYAAQTVMCDRGYDSDKFRQSQRDRVIETVIPCRSNRKNPHEYDRDLYRERHLVECFIT